MRRCRRAVIGLTGAAMTLAAFAAGPAHAEPEPNDPLIGPSAQGPTGDQEFSVGTSATDTFAGYLPDNTTLSPFDDAANLVLARLDPALLAAVQEAATAAAAEGIDIRITSGWRSPGFQLRLFDDGVLLYGSEEAARQFVATPENSHHVTGQAVDVGPPAAALWMSRNGPRFGLCQMFENELWHYELAADEAGRCPPMKPNAAG